VSLALVAGGWVLLALPLLVRPFALRMSPREFAAAGTVATASGVAALEGGLIVTAAPTLLRSAGLTDLAIACERSFRPLAVGGALVAWAAGFGALVIAALAIRAIVRAMRAQRCARADSWLGAHFDRSAFDLVILPTRAPLAYSVGGRRPQVIVSEGLVTVLEPTELEIVIGHEAAHVRARHNRYLVLFGVAERVAGWLPGVRASTMSLRASLERWADDEAAGTDPQRRKRLRGALLTTVHAMAAPDLAAFGVTALVERAAALAGAPSKASGVSRLVTWCALGLTLLVAVSALAIWLADARSVLAMAGYCPS